MPTYTQLSGIPTRSKQGESDAEVCAESVTHVQQKRGCWLTAPNSFTIIAQRSAFGLILISSPIHVVFPVPRAPVIMEHGMGCRGKIIQK